MKLVHPDYNMQIEWTEQINNNLWIIELPNKCREICTELMNQIAGESGLFVLSDLGSECNIGKSVEIIDNPLKIDPNSKKLMTNLFSSIEEGIIENSYLSYNQLQEEILRFFYDQIENYPIHLTMKPSIEISTILKATGMQVGAKEDKAELEDYLKIVSELMKPKLVVIMNFMDYYNDKEIQEYLKLLTYLHMPSLWIGGESRDLDFFDKKYIIDKDQCEIY